ncbi:alpha/beta hydrolase [Rhizocola hellebori]|uniref:Alpha/beta hydrolase n=1 Tax=Rhizocola hellebori TaxID=1392758 RepID=A0A8J3QAC3_9ACTN|nr:alpha/beta hydrolase [Rhizocola hellebori]GIH06083.1 alpha/beta hydrolase [Rhizocola hellebori]
MRRIHVLSAVAAALALITASAPATAASGTTPTQSSIAWQDCPYQAPDPRQQCAQLSVPRDYRSPNGPKITIAVSRISATDPALRRGILLLNPGGPGGSGLDLPSFLAQTLPAEVTARYDLIGFDPRGVGLSSAITCGIPGETPPDLVLPYPAPDGSIARNVEFARTTAASCAAQAGALLPHITTANTARDMDRLRAAMGERKLNYLGYSYGSYLGAVYTSLFPQRSDRIILDSAVNPNNIWYDVWRGFSLGIALRFPDFTAWAAKRNDIYGLGDTPQAVREYYFRSVAALDANPIPTPGLLLNGNVFREVTRSYLYDDRLFPTLAEVWQAFGTPGSVTPPALQVPVDNQIAVLYAIACNDIAWNRDVQLYARNTAQDRRVWPLTGGMPANLWPCVFWPHRPVEPPVTVDAKGPRNVLVLQNLRDPATPWIGGFGMRTALGSRAAMVTQDAGGHGIYGIRSGPCAAAIATAFLVNGTLPEHDRFCDGPSPEDVSLTAGTPARLPGPLGVALP